VLALSLFGGFVIVYNEYEFMGRLVLEFGGIDCEFGGSARLLPLLLSSVTTVFNNLIKWN